MQKQIGSVLLILGTCIGAAMLALPVVTSSEAYPLTVILMLFAWAVMTIGAWTLMRVNLWLPAGTNLVSMTRATLGKTMSLVTWVMYLLLLYSLICAYLAGSADLVQSFLRSLQLPVTFWQAALIAALGLGLVVYNGISSVDYLNRALMSVKLAIFFVVVAVLAPHMHVNNLVQGGFQTSGSVFLVMITSFGYAVILPSIRVYLDSDRAKLKRVVIIGSLLPLALYLIWIAAVQGVLPRLGEHGLQAMVGSAHTNTLLLHGILAVSSKQVVAVFGGMFIAICALTSFLGVSVCLMDFFADGLQMKKQGKSGVIIFLLTYLPPFLVVLLRPQLFTTALAYAGVFCIYVLIFLPLAMYIFGRKKFAA